VTESGQPPPTGIRLNKRMADLGMCSRREADRYIERGWVLVDGKPVLSPGIRVTPAQTITLAPPAAQRVESAVTVILNKPVGYVSMPADEKGYPPAASLITPENFHGDEHSGRLPDRARLAAAGRLDIDSTGLLVLTSDGRVARRLIGPGWDVEKEYLVKVMGETDREGLDLLRHGLELDGVALKPATVEVMDDYLLKFVLTEGRKRQIRRMCEQVGLKVTTLKRVRVGNVALGGLPLGTWRYLGANEQF
jgi:23S rRNA pseudouridine2604 synthase